MKYRSLLATSILALAASCAPAFAQEGTPRKPRPPGSQKLSNPVNDLLDEAQRAIEKQDFAAALVPLQKVVSNEPQFAYGHFQLGYVFTALKRWDDARGEYQRAIALDPKLAEAQVNLGILLLERDPAAAVAPLRRAVELLPSQTRPRYLLGLALDHAGDLASAANALRGAEALDPRDFDTLLALGEVLLRQNEPAEAETKFRAAEAILPDDAGARLGVAQSLDAQKKPEAAEAYRSYLELQPQDAAVHFRLARFLFEEKEFDAALQELDKQGVGATNLEAVRLRADILIAQSRWEEAIAALRSASQQHGDQADLRAGAGRIFLQQRNFSEAEKELLAALKIDPANLPAWKDLSSAYYLEGNCPAAVAALDEIARREAPTAGAWFVRATCYDKMALKPEAIEAYQKFMELDRGQNPNQEWQAQQRIQVLRHSLEKKR